MNVPSTQDRAIHVVEPQLENFFHAPFNAALLHAVALAFPRVPITFTAFRSHLDVVAGIVTEYAPEIAARISWDALPKSESGSLPARWMRSRSLFRIILRGRKRVLFTSISRMQLLVLKRAMRRDDQVRVILHGDLEQVESQAKERFPNNLFALKKVLQRPHPAGLRYIVLSESVRRNLPPYLVAAMHDIGVIDHPYHFPALSKSVAQELVLGIFGNSGEGHRLEEVVRAVKARNASVRFKLIGFLADDATVERLRPLVEDVTRTPIYRELFLSRASEITHTLWLSEPNGFRLRASGTFCDALAHGTPIIYTANPYIDSYQVASAGIAVRCESFDEVATAVLDIASAFDPATLAQTRAAIVPFRERFTPEAVAESLPASLAWD